MFPRRTLPASDASRADTSFAARGGGALGFVAPGVLALASSASLPARAATTNTQGMTMGDGESHLATALFPAGLEEIVKVAER